jgi:hypothetical protein
MSAGLTGFAATLIIVSGRMMVMSLLRRTIAADFVEDSVDVDALEASSGGGRRDQIRKEVGRIKQEIFDK